jgi:23S rRNA (guanosine2251-2'-O)-methyltransferase
MKELVLILHNIRSTHNVGAILRTAEGFGVHKIIFSGYTPYPSKTKIKDPDSLKPLPHIIEKLTSQIHKTALGAEDILDLEYYNTPPLRNLRDDGYRITGLEQSDKSTELSLYKPAQKTALILGEEVNGIPKELLNLCDDIVEIPMYGVKESFNVSVAAGIAMYVLRHR